MSAGKQKAHEPFDGGSKISSIFYVEMVGNEMYSESSDEISPKKHCTALSLQPASE